MAQQRGVRGEGSITPVRDQRTREIRYRIKIPVKDSFDRPLPPKTKLLPRGSDCWASAMLAGFSTAPTSRLVRSSSAGSPS